MSIEIPNNIREQEAKIMAYRKETNERLNRLLASNISLKEIAGLLAAEEFLSYREVGKGKAPVLEFNAAEFIDREVKKECPLQLPLELTKVKDVVLPPDEREIMQAGSGRGVEEKQIIPRSRYLIEVLSKLNQPYSVIEGTNIPNMMRGESYRIFIIPNLEKFVLVNDEEGNATFVIHGMKGAPGEWEKYGRMTKEELKNLGERTVTPVIYQGSPEAWKHDIQQLLTSSPFNLGEKPRVTPDTKESEEIPPDWIVRHTLAISVEGASPNTVKIFLDKIAPEGSSLMIKKGKAKYYDPRCLDQAREHFKKRKPAPPGWKTIRAIAKKIGRESITVTGFIDQLLPTHPEWKPREYNDAGGHPLPHYPPELVAELEKQFGIPEGSLTIAALAVKVVRSDETVERAAKLLSAKKPDLLRKVGKLKICLPELVQAVEEYFAKRKVAPVDWKTENGIAKLFSQYSPAAVKKYLRLFVAQHPEFQPALYDDMVGVEQWHYPLTLQEKFAKYLVENLGER